MTEDAMDYIEHEYREDPIMNCMNCSWEGVPSRVYMEIFDEYAFVCSVCGEWLDFDSKEKHEEEDG